MADSLRQLFATGLFDAVEAAGEPESGRCHAGLPRQAPHVHRHSYGNRSQRRDREYAARTSQPPERRHPLHRSQDDPGARPPCARCWRRTATTSRRFSHTLTEHTQEQLTDIAFQVVSGPRARVGDVQVTGDSGMTAAEFRKLGKLSGCAGRPRTVSRALTGVLKHYRKQKQLEAEIKLESQDLCRAPHELQASPRTRARIVKVVVEGASLSEDRIKRLVPVYRGRHRGRRPAERGQPAPPRLLPEPRDIST